MSSATLACAVAIGALGLGGCSLILDFDAPPDAPPPDAPVTDAQCQMFEPNDQPTTASPIDPGELMAAICAAGESDYYKLTVAADQRVSVTITFDNRGGGGDLNLRLLAGDGAVTYDYSADMTNEEEVGCPGGRQCPNTSLPAGTYVVQVIGATATVQAPYTLTYTQTAP